MQRSFDDLGTPLHEVTFCVLDLETTGGTAADGGITEIGAVTVRRRGARHLPHVREPRPLGPPPHHGAHGHHHGDGRAGDRPRRSCRRSSSSWAARSSSATTSATTSATSTAPWSAPGAALPNRVVDTLGLARRLLREEVPNCRLGTLPPGCASPTSPATAPRRRARHGRPPPPAPRAGGELRRVRPRRPPPPCPRWPPTPRPGSSGSPTTCPASPGVYLFRDGGGRTLRRQATDLRSVRSYFSSDDRRKVGQLLREVERIDHVVCPKPARAAVLECGSSTASSPASTARPPPGGATPTSSSPTRRSPPVGGAEPSATTAPSTSGRCRRRRRPKRVAEAIETAVPLRRCTATPSGRGALARSGPCAPAQLGVATCPCAGAISEAAYAQLVDTVRRGLLHEPQLLLGPIEAKMHALAAAERFEEAADLRDRGAALAAALRRQQRFDALRRAGRVVVEIDGRSRAELLRGRLVSTWTLTKHGIRAEPLPLDLDPAAPDHLHAPAPGDATAPGAPLPKALADELACVARVARPPGPPHPDPRGRRRPHPERAAVALLRAAGSLAPVRWFLFSRSSAPRVR
ncbi:MAG: UvrB/UvrC motif-containing protein [Acidimicrobiales bacterium]